MEILDIVNEKDEVIGQAEHDDIYIKSFTRRIVHVLIFNKKGEIALQFRSKKKKYYPQHWITTAGGHVQTGESYNAAALREMEEEVGIIGKLKFSYKEYYREPHRKNQYMFLSTYSLEHDGPFQINKDEVERLEFFSLAQIQEMIRKGEKFHPELSYILDKHFNIK